MTTYVIDFSDPLKTGFSIVPGGFNGPGGSAAATTLRLYGRGALEWGEAVDEDLVRITENYNSPTPPAYPIAGQLWLRTKEYWLRTGVFWYVMDPDTVGTWILLDSIAAGGSVTGGVTGTNTAPVSPVIGSYWYTAAAPVGTDAFGNALAAFSLYRYDSAYKQVPNGWLLSQHTVNALAPVDGVDYPERSLLIWDDFQGAFIAPPVSIVAAVAPTNATEGTLWWDSVNNILYVWNDVLFGGSWQALITGGGGGSGDTTYLRLDGANTPTANLTFGGFRLTNVGNAVAGTDALNQTTGDTRYINTTGDTMTGALTLIAAGAYPQPNSNLATTITYVNSAITSITGPGATSVASVYASPAVPTYKTGDIYVAAGVIYIAIGAGVGAPPGGNWRQVFPAQYS